MSSISHAPSAACDNFHPLHLTYGGPDIANHIKVLALHHEPQQYLLIDLLKQEPTTLEAAVLLGVLNMVSSPALGTFPIHYHLVHMQVVKEKHEHLTGLRCSPST
jgi:hypothetical protein